MSGVVHFEINCKDAAKTQDFYRELFDWKIDASNPMQYGLVEPDPPGIGGGIAQAQPGSPMPGVMIYVEVPDLDESLRKAESLGGKTLVPPTVVPDMVTFAVFADPEGHVMGIVKSEMPA